MFIEGIRMKWPEDFVNKLICDDCLNIMKQIPDKAIDLIITDPPYGIGESNEKNLSRGIAGKLGTYPTTDFGHYDWDKKRISDDYIKTILRVSKNQIIFGGHFYATLLPVSSGWIVWDKDNGNNPFSDCELAWTSYKKGIRKFKWRWNGMLQEDMANKEKRVHPTQKPLALMKWIINKYSKNNDFIFDPFFGSGPTLVAAKQLGHLYSGVDINPNYKEIAENLLAQGMLL